MAQWRAVVVSHAAGRSGMPSSTHRSSARSAASATASSARSQSPVVRISVATMRSRSPAMTSSSARRTLPSAHPRASHARAAGPSVQNGRSSRRPNRAIGCSEAMSIALSRSSHSRMSKPAIHSRVSANGPSVTSTLPPRLRTVVASAIGRSASPMTRAPLASWRSTQSSTSSSLGSPDGGSGSVSVQTNIMYFMSCSLSDVRCRAPPRRTKPRRSDSPNAHPGETQLLRSGVVFVAPTSAPRVRRGCGRGRPRGVGRSTGRHVAGHRRTTSGWTIGRITSTHVDREAVRSVSGSPS